MSNLQIGPIPYQLIDVEGLHLLDESGERQDLNGFHDCASGELRIRPGLSPMFREVVIVHEIVHALLEIGGTEYPHSEPLADRLAYGIIGLFRDNPQYFHDMIERVRPTQA